MDKTYDERLKGFQEEIGKLCQLYEIEIVATLIPTPMAIIAKTVMVDLKDDAMLKKYGLTRVDVKKSDESENPRIN